MAEVRPYAQAPPEPDGLEHMHAELCMYCQALVFNERDHSDTLEDHGYRLVWNDYGVLQLEIDKDRLFGLTHAFHWSLPTGEIRLRPQLIRKDIAPSLPSFTATAEAGCHMCRYLLFGRFKDRCRARDIMELRNTRSREVNLTIEFFYTSAQVSFGVRKLVAAAFISIEPASSFAEYFMVEADLGHPCAEVLGIRTNTYLPNWSFDEKMAVMREWVGNCDRPYHLGRVLPTRLLDLSSSGGPDQDVRLIYSKDIPRRIGCKYAALSHCWGSPNLPHLKTETDSLDKMLCNIPFESLTANYRDAVRVARGLGIDYLWVDSLCIVQDNLEDWETESLRMVDVYQQAHVTLIVATGNCCQDGFLDPDVDQRVQIPYVSSPTDFPINDKFYIRQNYDTVQDIEDSPWNQRGWTLQENAFSTRRLYFTQNAISFSCGQQLHLMDGTSVLARGILTAQSSLRHAHNRRGYYLEWARLTEGYSQRHLTCPQDRLPAISACAQFLSQKTNDRYFAGLWEGDLLRGLLWSCEAIPSNQTLAERIKFTLKQNFVAPSWSWASQTRRVWYRWSLSDRINRCQILDIEVSPIGSNSNPFGRLKSGHMVIHGAIRLLPMAPILKAKDCFQSTMESGYRVQYYMDWWEESMDVRSGRRVDRGIVQDVKMFLLARCICPSFGGYMLTCTCGLLLLSTGADEEYWRVGTFSIQHGFQPREFRLSDFDCDWSTIRIV